MSREGNYLKKIGKASANLQGISSYGSGASKDYQFSGIIVLLFHGASLVCKKKDVVEERCAEEETVNGIQHSSTA